MTKHQHFSKGRLKRIARRDWQTNNGLIVDIGQTISRQWYCQISEESGNFSTVPRLTFKKEWQMFKFLSNFDNVTINMV